VRCVQTKKSANKRNSLRSGAALSPGEFYSLFCFCIGSANLFGRVV
jgi:hypothetical protein